jgi:hypothetical protein
MSHLEAFEHITDPLE